MSAQPIVKRACDRRRTYVTDSGAARSPTFIERRKNLDRREHGFISRLRLFAGIPYHLVEEFLVDCPTLRLVAGQVLLEPGRPNNCIYLVLSGRLQVHIGDRDAGDLIEVDVGDCIGELSIIDGRPVSAFVVAQVAGEVLAISEEKVWGALMPVPGLARNLLRALAARMRHSNQIMLERLRDKLQLEHLQRELQIASRIQLSMLPSGFPLFPDHREIDLFATMEPATVVGGDFYDAFLLTPQTLFVAIGDVASKGVPAALFMARSMTQLRMEARTGRPPGEVLRLANARLCENNEAGVFVTLFCGVLDLASGEFSYSVGGHNAPLIGDSEGGFNFLPLPKSVMVGVVEGRHFAEAQVVLKAGQTLLLYTDGVTEAADPTQELFGEERFLEALAGCREADPRGLIGAVLRSIRAFSAGVPQADDITLLGLRYLGQRTRQIS